MMLSGSVSGLLLMEERSGGMKTKGGDGGRHEELGDRRPDLGVVAHVDVRDDRRHRAPRPHIAEDRCIG